MPTNEKTKSKIVINSEGKENRKKLFQNFDSNCPSCSRDHLSLYGQGQDHNVTLILGTRVKVKTRLYVIIGSPDDPIITDADENLGISFLLLSPRC